MAKITMAITSIADRAVAVAGTRVQLSLTALLVTNITIQWAPTNAGNLYIGDSLVTATRGLILNAANPVANISVDDTEADEDKIYINLMDIWIDAANAGDKVKLSYLVVSAKDYNS